MANHGYVKTKKVMTLDGIRAILDELNTTTFKNGLKIEQDGNWFSMVYPRLDGDGNFGSRCCWLETKRTFEMRHGGGTTFIWWIDTVILDTVARKFNGRVSDDGIEGSWEPPEQDVTLAEYFQKLSPRGIPLDELYFVPSEFHGELQGLNWVKVSIGADGFVEVKPVKIDG